MVGTTFAVFDHVSSTHAVVLPVEEICALAASRGIAVFIDGAHGLGSFDLVSEEAPPLTVSQRLRNGCATAV